MLKPIFKKLARRTSELTTALLAIPQPELVRGIVELFNTRELRLAPRKPNAAKICAKFYQYDKLNPHVAGWFLKAAQSLKREQNRKRYGIGALTERIRWDVSTQTIKTDGFRISNDIRACYARLVVMRDVSLCGLFTIKPSVVDDKLKIDGRLWSEFAVEHAAELWPERQTPSSERKPMGTASISDNAATQDPKESA